MKNIICCRWLSLPIGSLVLLCICVGCSKEKLDELASNVKKKSAELASSTEAIAEKAKAASQSAVQTVKENLPSSGSMALQITPPLETSSAEIEIISVDDGRLNVVQILSYNPQNSPSYPRVLLHGTTTELSADTLVGKSLSMDLFIQTTASGPMIASTLEAPVVIQFSRFNTDKNTLEGTLNNATLVQPDNQPVSLSGGTITALVTKGKN